MKNKKWGVINFDTSQSIEGRTAYVIEPCDTLQHAYSKVMRGFERGEINSAIVKIYQITDVEIREK